MGDNELAIIKKGDVVLMGFDGQIKEKIVSHIDWSPKKSDKIGYDHYMLKEIYEQFYHFF
jgi:glucosamine--fructose-6-phosphate aminotransferase (isomerizing)